MKDDRDDVTPARSWEPSPWSYSPAAYAVSLALWVVLGIFYLPILSMILAPMWMVLTVSMVPRWVARVHR
jgi:hypothetical protein